jgi:hypothetical protein
MRPGTGKADSAARASADGLRTSPRFADYIDTLHPAPDGRVSGNAGEARLAIERFLAASKEPVFIEQGEEPVVLAEGRYTLAWRSGHLLLEVWDEARNFARRVTGVLRDRPGRLELSIERFGKRSGTALLIDRERRGTADPRTARFTFREQFRRSLARQFPGWRITGLSSDPDLEHSLSPAFPRALIRKGLSGWAAIGAAAESGDPAAAVTFGIVWLDYLRKRERRISIEGLVLFLPAGSERIACLRLRYLNANAAAFAVFAHSADGYEDRVDLADYGNLDTRLEPCRRPLSNHGDRMRRWLERIAAQPGVEAAPRRDGSLSLRVRGLEFARATEGGLFYGLETKRIAGASNITEIERLAAELGRLRSPDAVDRSNPLFLRGPESWLESQVRTDIEELDATLYASPVYGQVPQFTGNDRDVIDLLAADRSGRLAVIELKASEEIHLPFQALDYWMRVKWHLDRGEFTPAGYFPGIELRRAPPRLLLVAPALDFHSSNEAVLRYFSPDIPVERIGVGLEWRKQLRVMFRYAG